jgi:hypothetical protein
VKIEYIGTPFFSDRTAQYSIPFRDRAYEAMKKKLEKCQTNEEKLAVLESMSWSDVGTTVDRLLWLCGCCVYSSSRLWKNSDPLNEQ